jgi:TPR repeat protein
MKKWLAVIFLGGFISVSAQDIETIKENANNGDANSQVMLADIYYRGLGQEAVDYQMAFYWASKASEQLEPRGLAMLGTMFANGHGVQKSEKESFYWYKISAELGHPRSQATVALMYYNGEGVLKDNNQAFHWALAGAEQGHAEAQSVLGIFYYYGTGTTINKKKAAYWIKKSYDNGNEAARTPWEELELWKY